MLENSVSRNNKYNSHVIDSPTEHTEVIGRGVNEILYFIKIDRKGTDYNALWQDPSISDKTLSFEVDSPLFLEVTLPDGTVLSEEVDESSFIENDAFYISLGDQDKKAIFINTDLEGEYNVKLTPNGDGEYALTSRVQIEGQEIQEEVISGEVQVTDDELEYIIPIEKSEDGGLNTETFEIKKKNSAPIASLDKEVYEAKVGEEVIFDASGSQDQEGDDLEYKWLVQNEEGDTIVETEYSVESIWRYTFENPIEGKVFLVVTDGEFDHSVDSELIVEEIDESSRIEQVKALLESLEEDTQYIVSKKKLWLRLIEILELPIVQNNDRLYERIEQILNRDIQRSLLIDKRLESTWMWWKKRDLITEKNEEILRKIIG